LYKRALSGEIKHLTGISDPYEPPLTPELYLNSAEQSPEEELTVLLARLKELGLLCGKPALKGKGA
ncbi:MAG: adenylyl-sulfate kinase, partial [Acidobacteriaceae bacterium]|nr:adenylyl-sulfate kinase [Acidobacteriaceae bacterium]